MALSDASDRARQFLRGSMEFSSGRARLGELEHADPALLRALDRRQRRRPRIIAVRIAEQPPEAVQATATVDDGSGPQQRLVFDLDRRRARLDGRARRRRLTRGMS